MTTQYYFDNFLQVGDEVIITPKVNDKRLKDMDGYKGKIVTINYETSLVWIDIDPPKGTGYPQFGYSVECDPQEYEPVTYRDKSWKADEVNKENNE
jgi:hypothetical protein